MTNSNSGNKQEILETINQFIKLLGKPHDATWVRYIDPLKRGNSIREKLPSGPDHQWFGSQQDLERLQERQSQGFNVFLITGNGTAATGNTGNQNDADIQSCPALFVEWDNKPIEWQVTAWKELGLPEPSIQVHTGGKSIHCYWVLDQPMEPATWRVLIKRLIIHCGSDTSISNPSRPMRMPGGIYHNKKTGEAQGTAEIIHCSERRYSVSEIEACLPPVLAKATPKAAASSRFAAPSGQWEQRSEDELINALKQVPVFDHDQGRRDELLNLNFRLIAEIGAERGLQLMQEHSPAVSDMEDYFKTEVKKIKAGSIWPFLREHYNIDISRTRKKRLTDKPVATTKPVEAETGVLADQLPSGWEENIRGEWIRRRLKSGDLAKLLNDYASGDLRFNELTLYAEYDNKTISSSELDYFYIQLSERGYSIPKKDAADCLIYQARKQSYHPIRDYLNHIKTNSDIVPAEISNLASKYLNSTNQLHDTMLRKTLVGAVARVMDPGCKFDTCLVLAGATGIGKSTFFKTLASPAWFCDTAQDQDKDLKMVIHSTWIYELAELETITGKKEAGAIKCLLSGSTDKFRAPYGSAMEDHDRKSIFVATCNRRDFLRDETGSRRYWVIPVPNAMHQKIDVTELRKDRDAIWKAAVLAYADGEKPFLDIQDELHSEQENKAYEPEDIWLAPMEHWLNKSRTEAQFTTAQALAGAGLRQQDHLSSDDQRRAAHVLRELGCVQEKLQTRVQGKRARLWKVGTNASDVSDQMEESETGQTNCAGTDHSILSQISDKKSKSFEFLSTEDTAAAIAAPPECETHREFRKRSEYLRQNDETCCTAIDSAVSDPSKKSETTPTSETGTKPTNACHKEKRARNQFEQSMRAHGKNHDLSDLIDAELLPQYKKYSEDELMAIREDAEKFWEHPQQNLVDG